VTEQELISRAKKGDQAAFAQLVTDHQNRVYTLAVRMVGDREEGADLAQEAFLKAWQALPAFRGESSFSTWMYRLTANVCLDFLRRRKRQPVQTVFEAEPSDQTQDPQRQLERRETSRAIHLALDRLPPNQRQILTLRELSGLSYQEIGQLLRLDIGTVKSRLARARSALRKILLAEGNFFAPSASNPDSKKRGDPT
jgi:RNA polymerase sigma-70 factor (ECF subfamily)